MENAMPSDNQSSEITTETPNTQVPPVVVKQPDNNIPEKPPTGFQLHPENINKKGRPPKGWSWSELLEDIGEELRDPATGEITKDETRGQRFKEIVGRKLWEECAKGNILAIKELFNRMEGLPRIKMEVDGKVDTGIYELVARIDKMLEEDDEQKETDNNKGNS